MKEQEGKNAETPGGFDPAFDRLINNDKTSDGRFTAGSQICRATNGCQLEHHCQNRRRSGKTCGSVAKDQAGPEMFTNTTTSEEDYIRNYFYSGSETSRCKVFGTWLFSDCREYFRNPKVTLLGEGSRGTGDWGCSLESLGECPPLQKCAHNLCVGCCETLGVFFRSISPETFVSTRAGSSR